MSFRIQPGALYQGSKPIRDPDYRRFVKRLPCMACWKTWNVDPCHTGPHGIGQKSCDLTCIPLCRRHHDEFDANPLKFAARYKLDIPALVRKLNEFYVTKLGGKAA